MEQGLEAPASTLTGAQASYTREEKGRGGKGRGEREVGNGHLVTRTAGAETSPRPRCCRRREGFEGQERIAGNPVSRQGETR